MLMVSLQNKKPLVRLNSLADPATGKIIGTCLEMTVEDVRHAVNTAHEAFQSYRKTSPVQRQDILARFHQLFMSNVKDIARLIVWENGKSWNDAFSEANYAASFISWFAGEAVRTYGDTIPCSTPGVRNFTIKQPIGVCALLVP